MLKLLSLSHPSPSTLPRSTYKLMKPFVDLQRECAIDRYCVSCLDRLPSSASCTRPSCISDHVPKGVLFRLPLSKLIQERLQGNRTRTLVEDRVCSKRKHCLSLIKVCLEMHYMYGHHCMILSCFRSGLFNSDQVSLYPSTQGRLCF